VQPSDKNSGQVISKSGQEGAAKSSAVSLEYMKKEVYPVMRAERTKLDKAMSKEDRDKLNQLREEYKKERKTTELFTEADLNMSAETMGKSNTSRMNDIRRQVLAIGNNYPKEMKESMNVLDGKKDGWKTGLAEASGNTMKSSTPSQIHGKPGAALDRNPIDLVTNPFLFLLWDAELPAATKKRQQIATLPLNTSNGWLTSKLPAVFVQAYGSYKFLCLLRLIRFDDQVCMIFPTEAARFNIRWIQDKHKYTRFDNFSKAS
jgi:hypothetical protein